MTTPSMHPRPARFRGGLLSLVAAAALAPGMPAAAERWVVDPAASTVTLHAQAAAPGAEEPQPMRVAVPVAGGEVRFDPDDPAGALVEVRLDVAGATAGVAPLDAEIRAPAWLDAAAHPVATLTAEGFTPLGEARYAAEATLAVRGGAHAVALDFVAHIADGQAVAEGAAVLDRYALGAGLLVPPAIVAPEIPVTFRIVAVPAPD